MIPKIIHTIWIGDKKRPEPSKLWADMNPDYQHMHWDEAKLNADLSGSLGNEYVNMYLSREDKQYSDKYNGAVNILRLLVLQKYGGIYFDADCIPYRPLTDDLLDNEFFSVHENELYCPGTIANTIIGSVPNHDLINTMVHRLPGCPIETQRSWIATGPMYLTRSLKDYTGQHTLYPSYYFLPTHWSGKKVDSKGFESYCGHSWGTTHNAYKK